jgi:hypothetical protein
LRIRNSTSCLWEGALPQHPDRSGVASLKRALRSKLPKQANRRGWAVPAVGTAVARSAPSCSSSRRRLKARTCVNLCWPRPATAATPPGSCQRGRWSPEGGPHPVVDLQPIAVTPGPGSSSPAVPSSSRSICPQRSSTSLDNSVRDRPVELRHQPSEGDPRVLPKPAVPQDGSRLGRG